MEEGKQLEAFEMWSYGRMLKINWKNISEGKELWESTIRR